MSLTQVNASPIYILFQWASSSTLADLQAMIDPTGYTFSGSFGVDATTHALWQWNYNGTAQVTVLNVGDYFYMAGNNLAGQHFPGYYFNTAPSLTGYFYPFTTPTPITY